jgi:hypothetical protein
MSATTGQSGSDESRLRLTVRELLAEPSFRLALVAGSAGLDLPVRWAHSTELLDPGPYLRGYEIVLTVGAALTDPGRCRAFARSVRASRASAIGYGIEDVTPDAPRALREACDQLGLPLFEVPPEVPFVSFTEWLAERLAAVHDEEHDRAETGRLLELIRSELASPEAIRGHLERADLATDLLVAVAVPAGSVPARFSCPPGTLLGIAGDVALLLVPDEERAAALAAGWDAPCGIGSPGPFTHLPRSLSESLAGLDLARHRGGAVRAGDLATFPALLGRLSARQIAPFLEQIARPLASYDAAHGTRLVDTLRAFLNAGGSVSTTSRELFLHPNTLRHRLARIEAIAGRNPLQFEDRIALAVAMWAWKS